MFQKIINHHAVRYIFFGVLTTLVNFGVYGLLRAVTPLDVTPANFISVTLSIIFAYFVNAKFVFFSTARTVSEVLKELGSFFSARLITMVIELGGVWLLVSVLGYHDMLSKVAINVIVLILNYVFSKVIFK